LKNNVTLKKKTITDLPQQVDIKAINNNKKSLKKVWLNALFLLAVMSSCKNTPTESSKNTPSTKGTICADRDLICCEKGRGGF